MLPIRTDVLIVGAGPTGLALAVALQQAGVDHLLIDARAQGDNTSRAAVIHAHTLDMLDAIGVVGPLAARGLELSRFTVRDRDRPLLEVGFDRLPSAFRHILMVPQATTEAVLADRLAGLGGEIRRGVAAVHARSDGEGALVRVSTAEGEREIRACYVVGADGMKSVIRDAAGIAFDGEAYGESFILADVRMDWPLGADEVSLFFSPAGMVVVAPLPDGSFRVVAVLDDAPEHAGVADVQRLLDARGPAMQPGRVHEVVWSSRFRVHHRLAETYRRGPFLLIGDAAHVHSPAGGQGMNTGLVDAVVLGHALTRVVVDREPDALLDDYAALRRPAARQVLTLASRLTRLATVRSAPLRLARNLLLRLLNRFPPFKRRLTLGLSGIGRRGLAMLPDREMRGAPASAGLHRDDGEGKQGEEGRDLQPAPGHPAGRVEIAAVVPATLGDARGQDQSQRCAVRAPQPSLRHHTA
jgi:2-polyprenyl-6-methoxyphenol hydroxylase-like FAD-dependent oxidoreductase